MSALPYRRHPHHAFAVPPHGMRADANIPRPVSRRSHRSMLGEQQATQPQGSRAAAGGSQLASHHEQPPPVLTQPSAAASPRPARRRCPSSCHAPLLRGTLV